jgi:hypothetical protein
LNASSIFYLLHGSLRGRYENQSRERCITSELGCTPAAQPETTAPADATKEDKPAEGAADTTKEDKPAEGAADATKEDKPAAKPQ